MSKVCYLTALVVQILFWFGFWLSGLPFERGLPLQGAYFFSLLASALFGGIAASFAGNNTRH